MEESTRNNKKGNPVSLRVYTKSTKDLIVELPEDSIKIGKPTLHRIERKPRRKLPAKKSEHEVAYNIKLPKRVHRQVQEEKSFSISLEMWNRILASKIASCIKLASQEHLRKVIRESLIIMEENKDEI